MWLSSRVADWLQISVNTTADLREEVAALKAENRRLLEDNIRQAVVCDWLRSQVNALQFERSALLEKAYGIRVPAPELVKQSNIVPLPSIEDFSFEDIGDEAAKKIGLPIYGMPDNA